MADPGTSGIAFHTFNGKEYVGISGGIIPSPITLGPVEMFVDGQKVVITATSGVEEYYLVHLDDYPLTADQRNARRGSIR